MTTRLASPAAFAALALVAASVGSGCAPPPKRPALAMTPIGTVPDIQRTPNDADGRSTTAPNSGASTSPKDAACTMSDVPSLPEVVPGCDVTAPKVAELVPGLAAKLELSIVTDTQSTQPGGRIDVTLTLKNKTSDPIPLYFTGEGRVRFEVEAFDAKGKGRVDLPNGKPPKAATPAGRPAKTSKIVLLAGGSAKIRVPWDAVKTRWAPEKVKTWDGRGPARAGDTDLRPGKYQLRIPLPILTPEKGDFDSPRVTVDVVK